MKVLVCPHQMSMGGSQINAIELAAEVRDRGHDVLLYCTDGYLLSKVIELGLPFRLKPSDSDLSLASTNALTRLVREESVNLVHAYEWGPALEAAFGPHLRLGTPVLTTVLSMDVPGFLPRHIPVAIGTQQLADQARSAGASVRLLEPPIDTSENKPMDFEQSRRRYGYEQDQIVLAIVCRLTPELDKLAGVLEAIEAMRRIAPQHELRLLIVGDGPGFEEVIRRANDVNDSLGKIVVRVEGAQLDPRAAYDCADIVLGMGSSILKGMAFGKPAIVQGSGGFWKLLTPDTAPEFLYRGWYGESGGGVTDLEAELGGLLEDGSRRRALGKFSYELVLERFSLQCTADRLTDAYREIHDSDVHKAQLLPLAAAAARYLKFRLQGRARR